MSRRRTPNVEAIVDRKRYCKLVIGFPSIDSEGRITAGANSFDVSELKFTAQIEKTIKKEPNKADISIWNLGPELRGKIETLNREDKSIAGVPVFLEIGYVTVKSDVSLFTLSKDSNKVKNEYDTDIVWSGSLRGLLNTHEPPDFITRITSGDGEKAAQTSKVKSSQKGPVKAKDALKTLLVKMNEDLMDRKDAQGIPVSPETLDSFNELFNALGIPSAIGLVSLPKKQLAIKQAEEQIAEYEKNFGKIQFKSGADTFPFSITYSGNTYKYLVDLCKSLDIEVSIQSGKLQLLKRNEPLSRDDDNTIKLGYIQPGRSGIQSDKLLNTGVIGQPRTDEKGNVAFDHIFIGGLAPGKLIRVIGLQERRDTDNKTLTGSITDFSQSKDDKGTQGVYRITKLQYKIDNFSTSDWIVSIEGEPLKKQK